MKTMRTLMSVAITGLFVASAASLDAGCENSSSVKEPVPDAAVNPGVDASPLPGTDGGGTEAGPNDCVRNPKTHEELINGCTDAVRITKTSNLPLLLPDGGLPPIP